MGARLYDRIASALEQRVKSHPADPLPSIATLADEYGVSYQTVWKATRVLADKGIIKVRMGARTVPSTGTQVPRPRDRLADMLRSGIRDGTWKTGEPLPKFAFFQGEHHVGQDTIARAMQDLAGEGLVHKKGKRWIVGPSRSGEHLQVGSHSGSARSKVVLVMCATLVDVNNFFQRGPFIGSFCDELMKQGYRLEVVLHGKQDIEAVDTIAGIEKIGSYISSLGSRYCGFLAHDPGESIESFKRCLAMALAKKRPVVLDDTQDNLKDFARSLFGPRVPFFRLFFDESAAAALAVKVLVEHGHRVIGFPSMFTPRHPWVPQRIECVRRAAAEYDPPPRILAPHQKEPFWTYPQDKPITVLNYLFRGITKALSLPKEPVQGVRALPSVQRKLLAATPSMASLLKEGVTAIIAGNDYIARDYHYWFRMMGINVPRDISMISFDNQPEFVTYPMSTIDPGFARLGYLAAHILIGDIPVRADHEGQIPSVCTLVDRGSVGMPKRRG